MISFTVGLGITFVIGYFVVKGLLGVAKSIWNGIKSLFGKGGSTK